jgi:hypothetical protein
VSGAAEAETDPRRIIDQLVGFWQDALARTAPVFRILREAAVVDAEVAALERRALPSACATTAARPRSWPRPACCAAT